MTQRGSGSGRTKWLLLRFKFRKHFTKKDRRGHPFILDSPLRIAVRLTVPNSDSFGFKIDWQNWLPRSASIASRFV